MKLYNVLFNEVLWREIATYTEKEDMYTLQSVIPFTDPAEINWFYSKKTQVDKIIRDIEKILNEPLRTPEIYKNALQRKLKWPHHPLHLNDSDFFNRIIKHDTMLKTMSGNIIIQRKNALMEALQKNNYFTKCVPSYKICTDYILGYSFTSLNEVVASTWLIDTCYNDADSVFIWSCSPIIEELVFNYDYDWIESAKKLISDSKFRKLADKDVDDWINSDLNMIYLFKHLHDF